MKRSLLSSAIAFSMGLMPSMALADRIVELSPLVPADTNSSYANTNYNNNSYYGNNNSSYSYPQPTRDSMALRARISTIPKGTMMLVKLDHPVSSYSSNFGDPISGTVESDIFVDDKVAIPAGSEAIGQISNVRSSGRMGQHGEIEIMFNSVKAPNGAMIPIQAHVITKDNTGVLKGNSYGKDILKGVGYAAGGTGVGALLGTATGGLLGVAGTGAVFGTGVGAIAGITYALARKGKDVVLPAGARLSIQTQQETKVDL